MSLAALGGPPAQTRVEYLPGVGAHAHQRVIAELLGVPVSGASLGLARHLTDRGVHIDRHRRLAGTAAGCPRPTQHRPGSLVELADVTPRERAQERPDRRRRRRRETQHRSGRARPQTIHVIDMGGAHQHRRHQRRHLPPRRRRANSAPQTHRRIHQRHHTQPTHQHPRRQQARIGDQRLIIENHPEPVNIARYSTHRKCLPIRAKAASIYGHSPRSARHFPAFTPPNEHPQRWIQAQWAVELRREESRPGLNRSAQPAGCETG